MDKRGLLFQRWTTQHIPASRQFEFWREAICSAFLAMTPTWLGKREFIATLDHTRIADLALNRVDAQAHGVARSDADIGRGDEECLFVNLQLPGVGVMRQCGREVAVRPGELILWDSARPWSIDQPDPLKVLSLSVPYRLLGKPGEQARNAVVRPCASFSPVLSRLLAGQMSVLAAHGHDLESDEAVAIADTLVELVGAIAAPDPARSNARHGLARRACAEIERRYAEADLSPGTVAESLRVSLRVLHESFAQQNQTFMDSLYRFRLQRAHALLTRRNQERSVAEIARLCGFRSQAHFARRFKQAYGVVPRTLKA